MSVNDGWTVYIYIERETERQRERGRERGKESHIALIPLGKVWIQLLSM